jgi:Ca2+-binding RTX toxin-like protein
MPSQLTQSDFNLLQVYNGPWERPTTNPIGGALNDDITSALEILGNNGNDRLTGTNVLLQVMNGGAGQDQIYGLGGQDNINGGDGNDFIEGGSGGSAILREVLNGNDGIDTLSYEHSTAAVTIDLHLGTGGNILLATGGDAQFDTVKATFENLVGSTFNDFLTGNDGANVIFGLAGDDTLTDGHGPVSDKLYGGDGNDTFRVFGGADILDGGAGIDTVDYSSLDLGAAADIDMSTDLTAVENAIGTGASLFSSGTDTIRGTNGANNINGLSGNDTIEGRGGIDVLSGGEDNDTFVYRDADVTLVSVDHITDFDVNTDDKIELSAIDANTGVAGNRAFTFIGTNVAFSGVAQVRYNSSTHEMEANVSGDLNADLKIHFDNNPATMSATDFVL